jgi:hypothetical protein
MSTDLKVDREKQTNKKENLVNKLYTFLIFRSTVNVYNKLFLLPACLPNEPRAHQSQEDLGRINSPTFPTCHLFEVLENS